ncbi:MAG TPA: hypothetical protein VGS57_05140 [Thermoanaerobaculia bacterium]|jgi:hypothetical protein|nr:hypothetical protein [Thermoanaerobaculia bacterium]
MPLKRVTAPLVLLALSSLAAPALARLDGDPDAWCGTTRGTLAVAVGVHDEHERERARVDRDPGNLDKAAISAPSAEAAGDIAVLSDDGSILTSPNPVDVAGIGIAYTPKGKGYQVATTGGNLADPPPGTKLDLGDDDVRAVSFPKGFKFSFFTKKYSSMLVHSDGNITFGVPDAESTERSVQRFLNGPPRIAPFFVDLNPETAADDAGVYVSTSKSAAIVTWYRLPQFGTSRLSTFQVKLDKTGKITFAFGDLEADEAVVGIAPGDGGAFKLVDYQSDLPVTIASGAVAEQFSKRSGLDDMGIANMFFSGFADQYDHLVVFLDFPQILLGGGAFAYEFGVKNEIKGIGQQIFDASSIAGSHGRLRSFVQMGSLANYPDNPDTTFLGTNTTMDVLGQETGHRWLAFLRVNSPDNPALLGRALSHWNFNFNSEASDMEGNRIQDNGDGTFTTVAATEGFSALDQYVMGVRAPGEVPDMFYVDGNTGNQTGEAPATGIRFHGTREDFSIQDVIAAEGPRVPAAGSAAAQKNFRMAFILVTKNGEAPKPGSVEKLDRIRSRWMEYFNQATDGRATVETNLVSK